jgi:hypothetical protein
MNQEHIGAGKLNPDASRQSSDDRHETNESERSSLHAREAA